VAGPAAWRAAAQTESGGSAAFSGESTRGIRPAVAGPMVLDAVGQCLRDEPEAWWQTLGDPSRKGPYDWQARAGRSGGSGWRGSRLGMAVHWTGVAGSSGPPGLVVVVSTVVEGGRWRRRSLGLRLQLTFWAAAGGGPKDGLAAAGRSGHRTVWAEGMQSLLGRAGPVSHRSPFGTGRCCG